MAKLWLGGVNMSVLGAIIFVILAIDAHFNPFKIYQSPGFMWGAAGCASAGATFCGLLFSELNKLEECAPKCANVCDFLRKNLKVVLGQLLILVALCIGAALATLAPVAGGIVSTIILIDLGSTFLIMAYLILGDSQAQLDACTSP